MNAPGQPSTGTAPAGPDTDSPEVDRAVWNAMLAAHSRITERLDHDLVDGAGMTLAEFEVLDHLAAADDHVIRMNDLAGRVRLSPSGLTRRFDTLVRRGWVTREPCHDDRRGINARLTTEGLRQFHSARGTHRSGVAEYVLANLAEHEVECLTEVLTRLSEANAPAERATRASLK